MKIGVCGEAGRQKGQTRGRAGESHQNADRQELLVYICSDASQEASEASAGVVLRGASFCNREQAEQHCFELSADGITVLLEGQLGQNCNNPGVIVQGKTQVSRTCSLSGRVEWTQGVSVPENKHGICCSPDHAW